MKTILLILSLIHFLNQEGHYSPPSYDQVESIILQLESDSTVNHTEYYISNHTYDLHPDNFDMGMYFKTNGDTTKSNFYYERIIDSYGHDMEEDYLVTIPEKYNKQQNDSRKMGSISQVRNFGQKSMIKISLHESPWRIVYGLFVFDSKGKIEYFRKYEEVE